MRYNHAFDVAFEIESDEPDGSDVTPGMARAALLRRIINLDAEDAWLEALGAPFDTYEKEESDG